MGILAEPSLDPRRPQSRLAVTPSGRAVWVELSGDDRLKIVKSLPSRWPEVIMARERGDSLDEIARWVKLPPPCYPSCRLVERKVSELSIDDPVEGHVGPGCLAWYLAAAYAHVETALNDLASKRARLMA